MELLIPSYKNLCNCKFDIVKNKLVLVGKNSVGKTNVLDAIDSGHFKLIGAKHEYKEVIYIRGEMSLDSTLAFDSDSSFMKLFRKLYETEKLTRDQELLLLVNEINYLIGEDIISSHGNKFDVKDNILDTISSFTKNGKDVQFNIGSGLQRRLIYQMIKKLSKHDLNDKYIILIDSPEVYSHPAMVRVFSSELKNLSKFGHLVIVVTHSANVVEHFYDDIREIAKMTVEEDNVKINQVNLKEYMNKIKNFYNTKDIFRLPNGKSNEALNYIIKSDLESFCKSILRDKTFKILFADIIVIGEGASEDILFEHIFSYNEDSIIYKSNVDFFTAFGKFYLPFFFILANMYEVSVVCMYDKDNLENRAHLAFYNAFNKYEENNRKMFITVALEPDLESEIGTNMPSHRVEKPLHIYNSIYKYKSNVNKLGEKIEYAIQMLL